MGRLSEEKRFRIVTAIFDEERGKDNSIEFPTQNAKEMSLEIGEDSMEIMLGASVGEFEKDKSTGKITKSNLREVSLKELEGRSKKKQKAVGADR